MAFVRGGVPGQAMRQFLQSAVIYAVALFVLCLLVLIGVQGSTGAVVVALAAAGLLACLAILGSERTAIGLLAGAYFTAPFYKGVAPSPDSLVTGTDALLFLGFLVLVPRLLSGRVALPPAFVVGSVLVVAFGLVASVLSAQPTTSVLTLTLWVAVMVGLPIALGLWRPGGVTVDLLAIAFVVGQIFSFGAGRALGNVVQGRDAGLATHPNYFAEGGIVALALLLYLYHRYGRRSQLALLLVVGAAAICGFSVLMSGSRAATVVVAGLIVMVPVVERSAAWGFLVAGVGALVVALLPIVVGIAGPSSGLARLTGSDGSAYSTQERLGGLELGLDRFRASPLTGSGMVDLFKLHNNYLEVVVGIGIFGLVGYLLIVWALATPIFGTGERRRLGYAVWAYLAFGATVPSLYDRTAWPVIALSAVATWGAVGRDPARGDDVESADVPSEPAAADQGAKQNVHQSVRSGMGSGNR